MIFFQSLYTELVLSPAWFSCIVRTLLHPDMRHKFRQAGWISRHFCLRMGVKVQVNVWEVKKCNLSTCLARNGRLQLTFFNLTAGFRPKWMKFLVPRETLTMRILANSPTYRRYCRSEVKYQSELFSSTPAISQDHQEEPHTFKVLRAMPVFDPDAVCLLWVSKQVPRAVGSNPALLGSMVLECLFKIPHNSFTACFNYCQAGRQSSIA